MTCLQQTSLRQKRRSQERIPPCASDQFRVTHMDWEYSGCDQPKDISRGRLFLRDAKERNSNITPSLRQRTSQRQKRGQLCRRTR